MILMQKEYEELLKNFVDSYILYKEAMEIDDEEEDILDEIYEEYSESAQELQDFECETYGAGKHNLPNMEVHYDENGKHTAFSYRMYAAMLEANQVLPEDRWQLYSWYYIGKLLNQRYGKID